MRQKKYFILGCFICAISTLFAQNPQNIILNTQIATPPVDSYTRASQSISLQPTFKYGFITGNATNLQNLSIGTYPGNIGSSYADTAAGFNVLTINPNLELGTTEGIGNVSPIGAFSYQFPLFCSPGMAGIQPNLAVTYNSNGSVTNMGLGFNLSGISSISRTNKLFYFDAATQAINLNTSDVFALDGDRLLQKTGTYGQGGATYKTEVENYARITSVGNSGSGPISFLVNTPEGKTLEFGNTSDSKLIPSNGSQVLTWYINKVTDEFGNYMRFYYNNGNGEVNIDRIEYTGNINAGLNPYNKVKFEYIDRADKQTAYFGGGEFKQNKILKSVTCTDINNQLVKRYVFDYIYSNTSLLSRITEIDANGNQLNPTGIDWTKTNLITGQNGAFGLNSNNVFALPTIANTTTLILLNQQLTIADATIETTDGSNKSLIAADLNGDGRKDLVSINCRQGPVLAVADIQFPPPLLPMTYDVFLSEPSANPGQPADFQKVTNTNLFNTQEIAGQPSEIIFTNVFDEDDDNIEEVFIGLKVGPSGYIVLKLKSDGTNYNLSTHFGPKIITTSYFASFPLAGNALAILGISTVPKSPFQVTKGDVTGDNIPDEIRVDEDEIKLFPSNGQPAVSIPVDGLVKSKLGDFDGDGVAELLYVRSNDINCLNINNQVYLLSGFEVKVVKYNPSNNTLNVISTKQVNLNISTPIIGCGAGILQGHFQLASGLIDFGDFNGDGKTDIIYNQFTSQAFNLNNPGTADIKLCLSNGVSFLTEQQMGSVPTKINGFDASFFSGDLNGDGKLDWCSSAFDNSNFQSLFNVFQSNGNEINLQPLFYSKSTKFASALGDFDGNGTVDFVSSTTLNSAASAEFNIFNRNSRQFVNRIYNIKSDYRIEYSLLVNNKSLSNYPLYRKTTTTNPNNFTITKVPLNVVTKTNYNDIEKNYAYENSLFHRTAKGFIGFEKFYTRDIFSNLISVSSFTYDGVADYQKNSSVTNGYANIVQNAFMSINTNSISSKSVTDLSYVITGTNRYLATNTTLSKDYLKSVNTTNAVVFDNTKDGKTLSNSQFSTPWNGGTNIMENSNSYTYISVINPFSGQPYYKVLKQTNTRTSNSNGILTSNFDTDFNYDGNGHLISKIENSNLTNAVTNSYGPYNDFGSPAQISITANDVQGVRTSQMQYDITGRFITKTTNALGNFEECIYEPKFGNKIQCKDISGLITNWQYDGLGRNTKTILPNSAVNTVLYQWYAYNPINNQNLTYYGALITSSVEGSAVKAIKYDRNNNVVETNEDIFAGAVRTTRATFNTINKLLTQTELATINQNSGDKEVQFTYDAFLRSNTVTQKIANNILSTINYSYNNISTDAGYYIGFVQLRAPNSNQGQFNFVKKENNEADQNTRTLNFSSVNLALQHISFIRYNQFNLPFEISNTFGGGTPIVTTIVYDPLGHQQQLNDPSSGVNSYVYNSIGELLQQSTPNGNYTLSYDVLGRLFTKSSNNNNYTYQYVTGPNGRQMLEKMIGPNETTEYKYDNLSRMIEKKQTITASNNKILKSNYTYDTYGRLINYTYPGGFTTTKEYDAIGTLIKIKKNNTVLWQLNNLYTPDLISQYTYGNGMVNSLNYDANQNLQQKVYGSSQLQVYSTSPKNGDVLARSMFNLISNVGNNEQFTYDDFNRLTSINYIDQMNSQQNRGSVAYNQNGNIGTKSDAGTYVYGQNNNPYRLTSMNNLVGNNISLNTLNLTYNDFNKVNQITEMGAGKQFNFMYGNDEQRVKMDYVLGGSPAYSRFYTDNYDLQEDNFGSKEWSYVYSPTGLCAINYKTNGNEQLLYVSTDHLGSPVMLLDNSQTILEQYSFDAWGRKRNPTDWNDYTNVVPSQYMIRGFTMHEMLGEVGIINMNGRVYDPVLGRFIQADNVVQDPENLQNYNRYSYVLNNPLKYTDPSGFDYFPGYPGPTDPEFYSFSVPTYQMPGYNYGGYSYDYSFNSGYGGMNYGYGGGYYSSYSGAFDYGGYSGNFSYGQGYSYGGSINYGSEYVTMNSFSSTRYDYEVYFEGGAYNVSQVFTNEFSFSYPNYDYQAKVMVSSAENYVKSVSNQNKSYGLGFSVGAGIGLFAQGFEANTGMIMGEQGFGQAFFSLGHANLDLPIYLNYGASFQGLFASSQASSIDFSGTGQAIGGGYGPFAASYGFGVDANNNRTDVYGAGVGAGIKISGGYTQTYTWTMLIVNPWYFLPRMRTGPY
jgi:RHS repeat-associated protein